MDVVREHISTGLAQSRRFSIVRSPEEASAILANIAGVEPWYHGMEGFYGLAGDLHTHLLGVGRLRLIETRTKQVIWTHTYKTGLLKLHQSVASRVADQVTERLLSDAILAGNHPPRVNRQLLTPPQVSLLSLSATLSETHDHIPNAFCA